VIDYKWENYGANHHRIGFSAHLFYVLIFCLYIQVSYIHESDKQQSIFALLAFGTLYPIWY
jgi:hypothetical protein